jgi:hypothetical protein
MRSVFPVLVGLTLAAGPARGDDAARIARLIEQLGADTFAEREAASKALDQIGAPALEAVQKATRSRDAEVRKRAAELAGKIGRRAASEAALSPKMVHLVFKDTPVGEAVRGLADKSGYRVVLSDPDGKLKGKAVTLDTGKVTFWAALDKLCGAAGVIELDPHAAYPGRPATGGLMPLPLPVAPVAAPIPAAPAALPPPPKGKEAEGKKEEAKKEEEARKEAVKLRAAVAAVRAAMVEAPPPVAGAGLPAPAARPVAVALFDPAYLGPAPAGQIVLVPGEKKAVPADTSSSIRVRVADRPGLPPRGTEREVALYLELLAEPRLRLQQVRSVQIDVAEDDHGQKLAQAVREVGSAAAGGDVWFPIASTGAQVYGLARLTKGEKEPKSLRRLEGLANAVALGDREEFLVVESPGKAAGQSAKGKHGGEIHVTAVTKQADGSVQITFGFEAPAGVQAETGYLAGPPADKAPVAGPPRILAGGVVLPATTPGQPYHMPWGLTLQDDKGRALPASIRPNYRRAGPGKGEYLATYLPGPDGKGEPAKLVFTGRRLVQVQVPFKLAGVELK